MSQRQLQRWYVMGLVEEGKIILKEAGAEISVAYQEPKEFSRRFL